VASSSKPLVKYKNMITIKSIQKRRAFYKGLGISADIYNNLTDFKSINYSFVNEGKTIKITLTCERKDA